MKLAFWKKSREKAAEQKPAAPAVAVAEEKKAPAAPTSAQNIETLRELLKGLTGETDPNSQDVKFLRSAFAKASGAVLADPSLVTEETFRAFADYAVSVKDKELRQEAMSALGTLTVRNAVYSDIGIPVLIAALDDKSADVRFSALNSLSDIGKTNASQTAKIFDTFVAAADTAKLDIREGAIVGLATLALKSEIHADMAIEVLVAALARDPAHDAAQSYTGRNRAALGLGQIGLAYPAKLDAAIKGLTPGLSDTDIFVQYRVIESLGEIGRKHEDKKDGIVESLTKAKEKAIYAVNVKLDSAINTLRPPVKPVKTPEQIEAERAREEENQKALAASKAKIEEESRLKAQAEAQKKQRHEGIRTLANKLPGAALK